MYACCLLRAVHCALCRVFTSLNARDVDNRLVQTRRLQKRASVGYAWDLFRRKPSRAGSGRYTHVLLWVVVQCVFKNSVFSLFGHCDFAFSQDRHRTASVVFVKELRQSAKLPNEDSRPPIPTGYSISWART